MSNIKVNPTELLKMSCGYWKDLTEVETWIDENQEMIDNISRNPKLPFAPFDPLTGFCVPSLLLHIYFGMDVNSLDSVKMNVLGITCAVRDYVSFIKEYPQIRDYFNDNFITMIRILINEGIDLNHQNHFAITPLMNLIFRTREELIYETVEFLLKSGADPFIMDYSKRNVISACEPRDETLIPNLIKEMFPIAWNRLYNTKYNDIDFILQQSNGIFNSVKDFELALDKNKEFITQILEQDSKYLNYYFVKTMEEISLETVEKMLICIYYGGNVNSYNKSFKNVLGILCAATRGHSGKIKTDTSYSEMLETVLYTCINCLINCGVSINHQDKKGITPLLNLIYWLDESIVFRTCKLLLDNGADPLIRNINGINFFDKCKQKKYKRLFELANQYSRVEVKYEHK